MSLAGSCVGFLRIVPREVSSFDHRGLNRRAHARLQSYSKCYRTWSASASSEPAPKRFEHFMKMPCGGNLGNLCLLFTSQSALLDAKTINFGFDKAKSTLLAKRILQSLARFLFLVGLGISLSLPASARILPPTPSGTRSQKNENHGAEATKKGTKDASAMHSQGDASDKRDESTQPSMSGDAGVSVTDGDELRLSDAFWTGIPTPDGSFLQSLKARLSKQPSDVKALEALLRAVLEQKDMLRALTVLETLLEIQPDNVEWRFLKARAHQFLGELTMAMQEYDELLSVHPLSARFLQELVKVLNEMGEETHALDTIKKALDQAISENKNVEARNLGILLGQFHIQLGNFEDAVHHLSSMILEDPNDFRLHLCQGLAYAFSKQPEKARESFKNYAELCPPDAFDQNYMDSLMLRAQTSKRIDTLHKRFMKSSTGNKKRATGMAQPTIFGKSELLHD